MAEKQASDGTFDGAIGGFLLVTGLALLAWGVAYDPTIESAGTFSIDRIVNVGRLGTKLIIFCAGGFSTLGGMLWIVLATLRNDAHRLAKKTEALSQPAAE